MILWFLVLISGSVSPGFALPSGGNIVAGSGNISQPSPGTLEIRQDTDRMITDWNNFDISASESVNFSQPTANSIALNRVTGNNPSQIFGKLKANGNLFLINPNGILFGAGSQVDVNGLVATTSDIKNADFMAGRYSFENFHSSSNSVVNRGTITVKEAGIAAFVAPGVENSGIISANLGRVNLSSGSVFTLDFYGDKLITLGVDEEVLTQAVDPDGNPLPSFINNSGKIIANGGQVVMQASTAKDIVDNVINMTGIVEAKTAQMVAGEIILGGGDEESIKIAGTLDASGDDSGEAGGTVTLKASNVILDRSEILATGNDAKGGRVDIIGTDFVSIGGDLDASGTAGGQVNIEAGGLSLASEVRAQGSTGTGGSIKIATARGSLETATTVLDVSGTSGGTLTHIAEQQITTSGTYLAKGTSGKGGNIDVSAPALKFLSGTVDASGTTGGGKVRLGGEYQGGKNLATDEIPNAQTLAMTDGTQVRADTTGTDGDGGTIITWADQEAVVLGQFSAIPGSVSGDGGFVEVSSGDTLTFGGNVETGIGSRFGTFLLDPKNIIITDTNNNQFNQIGIILGFDYADLNPENINLNTTDSFGTSVSLDGNRLAVGAIGDDGQGNPENNEGAVYLFTFSDSSFSGASLQSIIGESYTGGKNINIGSLLGNGNNFGSSVSLDDTHLAVGADQKSAKGSVFLFAFTDSSFTNAGSATDGTGALKAVIEDNSPSRANDFDQNLDSNDDFGSAVSLDGTKLAVGASGDDGSSNVGSNDGAVYLYTFTGDYASITLQAQVGEDYSGGNNFDQNLDASDAFGTGVSLNGDRLVVGAPFDDGSANVGTNTGAAYLYTFSGNFTSIALQGTVGEGYTGGNNLDLGVNQSDDDQFGTSLSLYNNNLAVGAPGDGGADALNDDGSVFMFTFSDSTFTGGSQVGRIGDGYTGGVGTYADGSPQQSKDFDVTNLDGGDNFGTSVSLNDNRLVAGAINDDGPSTGDTADNEGAVYAFTFTDSAFSGA